LLDRVTAELIDAITRTVPRLPGARCRNHRDLFDRTAIRGAGMNKARREALEICAGCPALLQCRRWINGLEPDAKPRGVIAGIVVPYTDRVFVRRTRRPRRKD
jgi:hypothetical protein